MASSSSCSHPAPATSSSSQSLSYHVFLSFRGEDTRKTFVDHLYSALVDRSISTYKDDEKLPRGESIRPALFAGIKASRIAVIIFSKNYADSSWCLDELAYIMKCKDKRGLTVMPIFYDVVPSEVRKQKRTFAEAFVRHEIENIEKIESWRKALVDASDSSGWEVKNTANGHEAKVIQEIADTISKKLFSVGSFIDEGIVGMSTRLRQLEDQLDIGSGGVRMVGVWGLGGSGKTTIASSLYMNISCRFQCHCIIENVREESSKHGLKALQQILLSTLLKTELELHSVVEGKHMIRSRLNRSNVLILLDDVDDLSQLNALVGSHNWFGSGSRIIITTRDQHLLRTHNVDLVCPVTLLSHEEALMLFDKHAYNKGNCVNGYKKLSSDVVSYAAGLPLALKVLGSFLYDKNEKEWLCSLSRLKDIPEMEIVEKLKISYDGLKTVEQELFLDIACFFRGSKAGKDDVKDDVIDDTMEVFEACGYYPDIGIKVLQQKALITIVNGRFDMHDLVQEMGHYIVRGEHPNNPEKHTRVWKSEDINNICLKDATTDDYKIEAMRINLYEFPEGHLSLISKIVSNMKKLRYFTLYPYFDKYDQNFEGPNFLSNELRFINWFKYSASPFPDNFQPMKLVILKLYGSLQNQLWRDYKHLPLLRVLILKDMKNLLSTPNFDGLPSLQKLTLNKCMKLQEIHPSFGKHTNLEYVEVHGCRELRMFPTIVHIENLKTLRIRKCHESLESPVIKSNLKSLVELSLSYIGRGDQCHKGFPQLACSLRKLELTYCGLRDGEIPCDIGELYNLQLLDLSRNDFTRLDFSLLQLTRLKLLNVSNCILLVELPKLPSGLVVLRADYCFSLTTLGDVYRDCKWLSKVSLVGGRVITDGNRLLQSMIEENALKNHSMILAVEGVEIAKEFRPRLVRGGRYRLELPENWSNDFSGFLMCAVGGLGLITMEEVLSGMDFEDYVGEWEESHNDRETVVWYVPFLPLRNTKWWNSSTNKELFFTLEHNIQISGLGVKLVARKSGSDQLQTLTQEEEYEISNYAPKLLIKGDSRSALTMDLLNY